jgi:hypothetical protein
MAPYIPTHTISSTTFKEDDMKKHSSKKGVSVVEAVIAMALISIVASASFTAITASIRTNARAVMRFKSISIVGDCLECFKYSDTPEEFEKSLEFAGMVKDVDYSFLNFPVGSNAYLYIFNQGEYQVVVTINWKSGEFNASATTSQEEVFYTFGDGSDGYKKGG